MSSMEEEQKLDQEVSPDISEEVGTLRKNDTQMKKGDTLDLSGIHWGYLNGWQSNVRGKKIKTERWFTYWVDLCGSTMRLYRDKSLPPDSATMAPSASVIGPSKENEQKVAFFGLQNATVDVLQDGSLYAKKLKQADFTKIFRRHLFRLSFSKINSTFIFQAPSNSSMLRWVSKIQEAITMSDYEQVGVGSVDERLKLAKFALEQRRWKTEEPAKPPTAGIDLMDDVEDFMKPSSESMTSPVDPRLKSLKENLREKVDLLNQLIKQEELFLGGSSDSEQEIIGQQRSATIHKDYYLIPGRKETYLCKGVKMTLFGQMPNKRWRCWVEIDDLISSMNKLIAEADDRKDDGNNNDGSKESLEQNKQYITSLNIDGTSNRGYPLIGSVPTSLVEELENFTAAKSEEQMDGGIDGDFVDMTPPTSPVIDIAMDSSQGEEPAAPYSSHARRTPRKTLSQLSFDTFFYNGETSPSVAATEKSEEKRSGSVSNLRSPLFFQDEKSKADETDESPPKMIPSLVKHSPLFQSSSLPLKAEESPMSSANNSPVMPVKLREGGFIIKKRLRQKGISIIVGSSSSEGESESDDEANKTIDEDPEQKSGSGSVSKRFSTSDLQPLADKAAGKKIDKKELTKRASATLPSKGTHNRDLLEQFGRSASIGEKTSEGPKLFPKLSGPDVKPPRNERRTLKLSKSPGKGYGFYLQTFVFTSKSGEKDIKTFVRYVEDEGPAYMAGLREGDVIVEIEGEDVNQKDHAQLVDSIKNSQKELKMVVKFTDAVKRAELAIKLKKKKHKLMARMKELEELNAKEKDLLCAASKDPSLIERADSATSSGIGLSDDSSENLSSLNEHVIIQTSRFEEQTSLVKDSISELRYVDDGRSNANNARTHITTTSDLLTAFSTDGHAPLKQNKSKPVNRSRSFSGSEKKVDPDSVKFRGRLNSKDDGFITAAPSQTKSRPAAKIIASRASTSDYNNRDGSLKKPFKFIQASQNPMFYNPTKERSGLPVKSRIVEDEDEKSVETVDGQVVHLQKSGTLSHPARDRVLSRNSRTKSYKIAVTTTQDGNRPVAEKVITYDQLKPRKAPETDL